MREKKLRRMAERQNLKLQKSPENHPHANGFGLYRLVEPDIGAEVTGSGPMEYSMTLDEVENFLTA